MIDEELELGLDVDFDVKPDQPDPWVTPELAQPLIQG